jgi:predicted GIY-YIG superfamily endonuclease
MTLTEDGPDGRSQDLTCAEASEAFSIEEVTLENSHLLPDDNKKAIYFVTPMQGENKEIVFIGFTENLRKKFAAHKRRIEFEFLNRMGYQTKISWIALPEGTSHEEGHAAQRRYIRAFEPKLNDTYNTIGMLQAQESKKQNENCEQNQYGYLDKRIKNLQQAGDNQETVIKKIWEEIKERLMVNI